MIPKNLTHNDFLNAAKDIDKNGIPHHRKSYRYFLVLNDKEYPPKYIITHSYELKNGKELSPSTFNAVEAKNYFDNNGYKIRIEKSYGAEIILRITLNKTCVQSKDNLNSVGDMPMLWINESQCSIY